LPIRLRRPVIACIPGLDSWNLNNLVLIPFCLAREARGRFAKGNSGNPNPKRRVPDLAARPLSAQALSDLIDRKPQLLRPLAEQLLPPPLTTIDPAARLRIDLSSLRTFEDLRQVLATVLAGVARGDIAPAEAAYIAERAEARLRAARRVARMERRPARETGPVRRG